MRLSILFIYLFISVSAFATDPVTKIAKANEAKKLAEKAFKDGNYKEALAQYNYLLDSLKYTDEAALLNRAHSYFQLKDTLSAFEQYREASLSANRQIKSTALNQLGNLSEQQKQLKEGLQFYKEALRSNPNNKEARFNYELLKKKMEQQEQQKQDDQNKDKNEENEDQKQEEESKKESEDSENQKEQENEEKSKEGESEEQKDKENAEEQKKSDEQSDKQKEGEEKEQQEGEEKQDAKQDSTRMPPSTKQKLESMNVSEEKAQMILEALRNKEAQYLQQMRKKATKRSDSGKPDW